MIQVALPEQVVEKLQAKVRREEQKRLIDEEQKNYEAQHPELFKQYAGQYIAMYHSEVVDTDADGASLSLRIRARFGNTPVLITPVLDEPIETIYWRRVRMGTTNEK